MARLFAPLVWALATSSLAQAANPTYEWLGETVPKSIAATLEASCPAIKDLKVGEPQPAAQAETEGETGVFRIRFSAGEILYAVSCDMGASNVWWAAALLEGKTVTRLSFPMADDTGQLQTEQQVGGLQWDSEKSVLRSGLLRGCAGANQLIADFRLVDGKLQLVHQEVTDAGENCDKPVPTVLYPKSK